MGLEQEHERKWHTTMDLPDASEASNQDAPNDAKEELFT